MLLGVGEPVRTRCSFLQTRFSEPIRRTSWNRNRNFSGAKGISRQESGTTNAGVGLALCLLHVFAPWIPRARIATEAGTHSIWVSERLREFGHEVLVANVQELRAITHSGRKSD